MTLWLRARLLVMAALVAAAAGTGCAAGVIPGRLPTWAADTLGPADLDLPRPVLPSRVDARSVEQLLEPVGDPRGFSGEEEASVWVETELRDRGLRFGTDGSVTSLYQYMRDRHDLVAPGAARPGDVVFFDLGGRNRCGDHAGVVDEVDDSGRIAFREARGGLVRLSFAHPGQPSQRRGADGRVLNTFLRIRRVEDPIGSRYLAGSLLCAVGRVNRPAPRASQQRPGATPGKQQSRGPGGGRRL